MAKISWTSSSLNSFLNASLNLGNSPYSGIYNSLGDASLIKSGAYTKLMKSYVKEMKKAESDNSTSGNKTESDKLSNSLADNMASAYDKNGKKTEPAIKNTVLDDILSHKPYESKYKNSYLDKMLAEKEKALKESSVTTKSDTTTATTGSVINEQL